MQLSIVIPSHLRADLLRRCLAAVAAYLKGQNPSPYLMAVCAF